MFLHIPLTRWLDGAAQFVYAPVSVQSQTRSVHPQRCSPLIPPWSSVPHSLPVLCPHWLQAGGQPAFPPLGPTSTTSRTSDWVTLAQIGQVKGLQLWHLKHRGELEVAHTRSPWGGWRGGAAATCPQGHRPASPVSSGLLWLSWGRAMCLPLNVGPEPRAVTRSE